MIATEFGETYASYENFMVLAVNSIEEFLDLNDVIPRIFKDYYKFPVSEFNKRKDEIEESHMDIIVRILANVDDKYFFVFTLHDSNHMELIKLQRLKIMNFGTDIEKIDNDKVYIIAMDKNPNVKYDF